jgi:hypothetical protein
MSNMLRCQRDEENGAERFATITVAKCGNKRDDSCNITEPVVLHMRSDEMISRQRCHQAQFTG